jgi:hypothetical protein
MMITRSFRDDEVCPRAAVLAVVMKAVRIKEGSLIELVA